MSDISPIRALGHLGRLVWLENLFQQVMLPPAVSRELSHPPAALPPIEVRNFAFLTVQAPAQLQRVSTLRTFLDVGEAEAIALAEEVQANVVLIDELAGRSFARQCGFVVQGTLGILLQAKQVGLCTEVRPQLDRLQQEINFFVSPQLRTAILRQAGE